jgi:hypothetical protein
MCIATRRTVKGGDPPRHSIEKMLAILERAVQSHSVSNQPGLIIRQLFHISRIRAGYEDDAVFPRFKCGDQFAVEICKYKYQVISG